MSEGWRKRWREAVKELSRTTLNNSSLRGDKDQEEIRSSVAWGSRLDQSCGEIRRQDSNR